MSLGSDSLPLGGFGIFPMHGLCFFILSKEPFSHIMVRYLDALVWLFYAAVYINCMLDL